MTRFLFGGIGGDDAKKALQLLTNIAVLSFGVLSNGR